MIGCVLGDVAVGVLNPFFHLLPSSWGETGDIQSISNADHVRGMKMLQRKVELGQLGRTRWRRVIVLCVAGL